jgi:hypothetical protein
MGWRNVSISFIGLLILVSSALLADAQSAPPSGGVEDNQGLRDDRAPAGQKQPGSAEILRQQAREQTVLRAFFERWEAPCLTVNGLLKLGPGRVEFVFGFTQPASLTNGPSEGSPRESKRFVSFWNKHCTIAVHIFKEVLRDGQRVKLGPLVPLSHEEWPPARAGTTVFDFPTDRIYMSGQGFPHDPEPTCIIREGLFAITPSGLQLAFREPRYALPFDVDQYVLRDQRRVIFEFTTSTCRLVFEVEKYIEEARLAPLE